jgi:membrane protease YdiL (CAAX protease family)
MVTSSPRRRPLTPRHRPRPFPAPACFFYINTEPPATGSESEEADVGNLEELGTNALAWLMLAVPGGLICLALWYRLPAGERRLLPWPRPRPVPWLGVDVWAAFVIMLFVTPVCAVLLQDSGLFHWLYGKAANADTDLMHGRRMLWAGVLALPVEVAIILGVLTALRGARLEEVGLTGRRAAQNITAGYLIWLVLTPVALLLYWAVKLVLEAEEHPMELLARQPLREVEWLALVFLAVVAAPLREELVFRGVLLPWQTNRGPDAQLVVGVAALAVAILMGTGKGGAFNAGPMIFILAMLPGYVLLPYGARWWRQRRRGPAAERNGSLAGEEETERGPAAFLRLLSEKRVNVLLALYGNGLLFAALHGSIWPTPIPLFVLGVGLAWLAHRTQSLVGPLVAHALFNGVATLDMFLS